MVTQLPVYLYLTSLYLYLKKTYWRLEDRWLCGGDGLSVMRYGYQVASVFVFDLTLFVFEKRPTGTKKIVGCVVVMVLV